MPVGQIEEIIETPLVQLNNDTFAMDPYTPVIVIIQRRYNLTNEQLSTIMGEDSLSTALQSNYFCEHFDRRWSYLNNSQKELLIFVANSIGYRLRFGDGSKPSKPKPPLPEGKVYDREGNVQLLEDCLYIKGSYYHKDSKRIVYDFISNDIVVKDECDSVLVNLRFTDNNEKLLYDIRYVHKNYHRRLIYFKSRRYGISGMMVYDLDSIKNLPFRECNRRNVFVDNNDITEDYEPYKTYKNVLKSREIFPGSSILTNKDLVDFGVKSPTYLITEGLRMKFGAELEVNQGYLPEYVAITKNLNVSCVRDGSVNNGAGGAEIVTGVLTGDAGFMNLQKVCIELSKRSTVDKSCGLHAHIGGIDFTNQFIVNSYILFTKLQQEIFSLTPKSRRGNMYCRALKKFDLSVAMDNNKDNIKLSSDYNTIFAYVSHNPGTDFPNKKYNKSTNHPLGSKCSYNRETPRYCWINYVPAIYDTRGAGCNSKTIEIRNAPGTTNFIKSRNWILMFMALCEFADKHYKLIDDKLTLEVVLRTVYPKKGKSLVEYFNKRKQLFSESSEDETEEVDSSRNVKELIYN
jgi:hypothetical protein